MCNQIHHTIEKHYDICRKKAGENFVYYWVDEKGKVENETLLEYIKNLAIPPMWENVSICSNGCGHIQAFGYDQKGRKQYIYHQKWQEERSRLKFKKLVDFATMLPTIRRQAHKDIKRKKWVKQKALGLAILMLDETHIRIGNSYYEQKNGTHGLTTLRRKHMEIDEEGIHFEYKAKSNKFRKVDIHNNQLIKLIKKSSELPGYEIFRYKNGSKYQDISSSDVNEYLQNITHSAYSAKDFRTWGGTSMAVEFFPDAEEKVTQSNRLKLTPTLIKIVAKELGNTPSICKDYYIHPAVLEAVENKDRNRLKYKSRHAGKYALSAIEKTTLKIIS